MKAKFFNQDKISRLVIIELVLIFMATIGFSIAVVYSMASLRLNIQDTYTHPIAVNNAGFDAYVNLSHIHNHMAQLMLDNGTAPNKQSIQKLAELDMSLRSSFDVVKAEYRGDVEKINSLEHLLENWVKVRLQMVELFENGQKSQGLKLAMTQGNPLYRQLENSMWQVVSLSQKRVDSLINEANAKSNRIFNLVWWLLGGLILTSIISGTLVVRKISAILELGRQAEAKLHANEERLKMALSGADIGTWDLYPASGKLDFDSQWGGLLNFTAEKDRPHHMDEWIALIHPDDKDRVLKAMQEHIDGKSAEYKAEYRIYSNSGKLKWVSGHGKAVQRGPNRKAQRIVGITRDITQQKQAEDMVWKLAHTDSLTGLPNRALFYDRFSQSIAQAKRQNKKIALLFLDLDDFKLINDNHGHDSGDMLLKQAADRLRQNIRDENTIARTGGDEFIIILNDISNTENATTVAKKIIQSLSVPFEIHGHHSLIGCSIGIAIYPDDSNEMDTLVTLADSAMYRAKAKGKNNFCFVASGV